MHPADALFEEASLPRFIPVCDHYAGSEKLMRKSLALQLSSPFAFDVTLDCEDGASSGNEIAHAELVRDLLIQGNYAQQAQYRVGVRLHHPGHTAFRSDLALIVAQAAPHIAYLMLPKIQHYTELREAIQQINQACQQNNRASLPIHVLIETHQALADVDAIAALEQVESLSFGIMDFVSAHHGALAASTMRSPLQFSHPLILRAKCEILAACHRYGKVASHNVCTEFKDMQQVLQDAAQARQLGFTRMWSIHPQQIAAIYQQFSATADELSEASSLLQAAQNNQWGPIQFNSRLHDKASYRYYWTLLKRAHANQQALPAWATELLDGETL